MEISRRSFVQGLTASGALALLVPITSLTGWRIIKTRRFTTSTMRDSIHYTFVELEHVDGRKAEIYQNEGPGRIHLSCDWRPKAHPGRKLYLNGHRVAQKGLQIAGQPERNIVATELKPNNWCVFVDNAPTANNNERWMVEDLCG